LAQKEEKNMTHYDWLQVLVKDREEKMKKSTYQVG
jgi:hypothetical protein